MSQLYLTARERVTVSMSFLVGLAFGAVIWTMVQGGCQ